MVEPPMLDIRSAAPDPAPYLGVPGFEVPAEQLARQKPNELLLASEGGRVVARGGLWWNQLPSHPGHRLGAIGHYFATAPAAGEALLNAACSRLAAEGCTLAVGPMDGSTWQRYRLVTERGSEPPFFLEPDNPDDWPGHFLAAGFAPLAHYHSALTTDLGTRDPRSAETAQRLADRGIAVRPVDLADFAGELRRLHALSLVCFADNFLFTPITLEGFVAQYAPVRPFLRSELILLAEREGELVGFMFAVPDLLQAKRGLPIDTAIAKTIAVHPNYAGVGLGSYLLDRIHQAMHECGYRRAIHALFHEDNRSGRMSRRTAGVMRRYTLFACPLGGRS
jgi:GNAT superfamily N-acetyltransferase